MLNYDTGVRVSQPITPAMQQQALAGLTAAGGAMQYPGSAADVYRARALAAGIDYERSAAQANNEYLAQAQRTQQESALAGLGQMAQAQQYANELDQRNRSMRLSYLGGMNGGLNSVLGSLF